MSTFPAVAVVVGAAAFASALSVAYVQHLNRQQHQVLRELELRRVALDTEWGQLLLEQSTLADPQRVERIAAGKLGMVVPQQRDMVVVWP